METKKESIKGQHTPTPWHLATTEWDYSTCIEKDGRLIARCGSSDFLQAERDAAFICRAVNSHEVLLEAAKWARATLELFVDDAPDLKNEIKNLDDAIAQAEDK